MEQDCAFELGQQVVDGVGGGDDVVGVVVVGGCCGGGGGGCCDVVFVLLQLQFLVQFNNLLFTFCMQQQFKQESKKTKEKKIKKKKHINNYEFIN